MGDDQHGPFFELIGKMFDHVAKYEPRLNTVELRVQVLWWTLIGVGAVLIYVCAPLLVEYLKHVLVGK